MKTTFGFRDFFRAGSKARVSLIGASRFTANTWSISFSVEEVNEYEGVNALCSHVPPR